MSNGIKWDGPHGGRAWVGEHPWTIALQPYLGFEYASLNYEVIPGVTPQIAFSVKQLAEGGDLMQLTSAEIAQCDAWLTEYPALNSADVVHGVAANGVYLGLVPRAQAQAVAFTAAPTPEHRYDAGAKIWKREATLAEAKRAAKDRMNAARETAIAAGVSYGAHVYQTDAASVARVTAVVAAVNAGVALPQGFTWRSAENVDVPFTAADLQALATLLLNYGYQQHLKCRARKDEIDAAAAIAGVNAVVWI